MIILHTADLHIKLKHDKRHRKDLINFIRFFLEIVDKIKPNFIFISGDIFDTKLPTPAELSLATAFIKRILDKNIQLVIIPGNHDIPAHEGSYHTLQPLENLKLKNLHIFSEIGIYNVNNIDILAVPYQYKNLKDCMTTIKTLHDNYNGNSLFFIGHLWVNDYIPIEPPVGEFAIDKSYLLSLNKIKYGALGHIHNSGNVCGNFFYSGSPFRITIAEEEPKKYIYIFDNEKIGTIQTPAYPIVKLDIKNIPDINNILNSICVIYAKDITVEQLPFVDKVKTALENQGNFVYINLELKKITFSSVTNTRNSSIDSFIEDYIKKNNILEYKEKISSLCKKIIDGSITTETSVFKIDELEIKETS